MKKLLAIIVLTVAIVSCKPEPKNYATLSGKIENVNEQKKIIVYNRTTGFKKDFTVNDDGTFSDTLKVAEGRYNLTDGNQYATIYLKNDNETSLTVDADNFYETLTFSGDAADENNFIIDYDRLEEKYINEDIFYGDQAQFDSTYTKFKTDYEVLKTKNTALDSTFFAADDKDFEIMHKKYKNYHTGKLALRKAFPLGMESPSFENYENFAGGNTSLADLKGKYVYIDVWATWCGPCKFEIPALKVVEEKYHDKNIHFVSISVDDARYSGSDEKAHEAWKTMVADQELGGIQLFSDKAWKSEFIQEYKINSIPRFLLIDPEGKIISADAPRPSGEKLIELFDSLSI